MSDFTPPEPPTGGTPPPPPPGGATPPPPPPTGGTPPPPPAGGTPPPPPPGGVAPPPAPGAPGAPAAPLFNTPPAAGGGYEPAPSSPGGQFAGAPGAAFPPQQGYGAAGPTSQPAEWGTRALAYLIDLAVVIALYVVVFIVSAIFGAVSETLGGIVGLVGLVAVIAFGLYNAVYLQGTTGQTIGKKQQGIRLQSDATGQSVGAGMAFVRGIVGWAISTFTCGIGGILDLLWPLWDNDKKRLTDKVLKFSVVVGGEKGGKLLPFM